MLQGSNIGKGHLLAATDALLANTSQYAQRLSDLQSGTPAGLVALAQAQNVVATPADKDHADNEWLANGGAKAWWPNVPQKEEILRQGFIKAYQVALAANPVKPIKTFWLHGYTDFEVGVAESDAEVNLFILTPAPPANTVHGAFNENIWIVARDSRIDEIVNKYSNKSAAQANVSTTSSSGIKVFRVLGAGSTSP
jgi:hypothetical protein